jgi:hypothetical protein
LASNGPVHQASCSDWREGAEGGIAFCWAQAPQASTAAASTSGIALRIATIFRHTGRVRKSQNSQFD